MARGPVLLFMVICILCFHQAWQQNNDCPEDHYLSYIFIEKWGNRTICRVCNDGCQEGTCQPPKGQCVCRPGWQSSDPQLPVCDQQCLSGTYGQNCQGWCGQGCQNNCDTIDGHCDCKSLKWKTPKCDECTAGYYGPDNQCDSTCSKGCETACDPIDGACNCSTGWAGIKCNECKDGYYGRECSETCGLCANKRPCNKTTGECSACQGALQLPYCKEQCDDGWYGQNCQSQCGQCGGGEACDKKNGQCTLCSPGWIFPLCQQKCGAGRYGQDCQQSCGQCQGGDVCDAETGHCSGSCERSFQGPGCDRCARGLWGYNCSRPCGHCVDGSCHMDTGSCSSLSCLQGWSGADCVIPESKETTPTMVYILVTAAVTFVLSLLAVLIYRFHLNQSRRGSRADQTVYGGATQNRTYQKDAENQQKGQQQRTLPALPAREEEEGVYSEADYLSLIGEDDDKLYSKPDYVPPMREAHERFHTKQSYLPPSRQDKKRLDCELDYLAPASRQIHGNQQYEPNIQNPSLLPSRITSGSSSEEDTGQGTSSTFVPFDLAYIFSSNPADQQLDHGDDSADKPVQLSDQQRANYDRPTIYRNAAQEMQLYQKLQASGEELYDDCEEAKPSNEELYDDCEEAKPSNEELYDGCEEAKLSDEELYDDCEEAQPSNEELYDDCDEAKPANEELYDDCEEAKPSNEEFYDDCEEAKPSNKEL